MLQKQISLLLWLVSMGVIQSQMSGSSSNCPRPRCDGTTAGCINCYKFTASNGLNVCAPATNCKNLNPCTESKQCLSPTETCVVDNCCKTPVCLPRALLELCGEHDDNHTESFGLCYDNETFVADPIYLTTFGSGSGRYYTGAPATFNFSTTYQQQNQPPTYDGSFSFINKLRSDYGSWLESESDHTQNDVDGYMMLINAAFQNGEFYRATFDNLCVGLHYEFSLYVANVHLSGGILPNLLFEARSSASENTLLAQLSTDDIPTSVSLKWIKYAFSFTASNNSIVLIMKTNVIGGHGNDFVIDDIALQVCSHAGSGLCQSTK